MELMTATRPIIGHSKLTGSIPKAVIRLGGNGTTGFGDIPDVRARHVERRLLSEADIKR